MIWTLVRSTRAEASPEERASTEARVKAKEEAFSPSTRIQSPITSFLFAGNLDILIVTTAFAQ